jgi:hypothetical protein
LGTDPRQQKDRSWHQFAHPRNVLRRCCSNYRAYVGEIAVATQPINGLRNALPESSATG